jgi:hypothetical protein
MKKNLSAEKSDPLLQYLVLPCYELQRESLFLILIMSRKSTSLIKFLLR